MAGWVENQLKSDHSVRRGRFRLAGCQWWGHSALLTFIQATQLWPHNVGKVDLMGGMLPLGPSTSWSPYQNKILLKYRILCKPAHWLMIIQFCLKVSGTATWRIQFWGIWVFENPLLAYLPNDLLYNVKMCGDPCNGEDYWRSRFCTVQMKSRPGKGWLVISQPQENRFYIREQARCKIGETKSKKQSKQKQVRGFYKAAGHSWHSSALKLRDTRITHQLTKGKLLSTWWGSHHGQCSFANWAVKIQAKWEM